MSIIDSFVTDNGYAADLEQSLQFEYSRKQYYRQDVSSSSSSTSGCENYYPDISTDSETTEPPPNLFEVNRCSTPIANSCVGCRRPEDRCRCRLKCRAKRNAEYVQWRRDLNSSFEVQLNAVELPEALSGNYTPAVWRCDVKMSATVDEMSDTEDEEDYPVQRWNCGNRSVAGSDGWKTDPRKVEWSEMSSVQQRFQMMDPYHPIFRV